MKESDNLYSLVKSLNKTEKAYFKKYASRHVLGKENKYVVLFDEITNSLNGYDERKIKEKFSQEKFVKNFPVIKKYVNEIILKSLDSFYLHSSSDNKVKSRLRYIEILYKKGIFRSCAKILNKSLKIAYDADNFLLLMELLKWKKNLINQGVYTGNQFINLEKAWTEEQGIINKMKNLSDYRLLSYKVRSLVIGTNPYHTEASTKKKELLNILNHLLLQSEKEALSYPAVLTHYHTLADIHDSLGNNRTAFECRKELLNAMEKRPETLKANFSNYIVFVLNLLGTCLNLKIYDEVENYIRKLRAFENNYANQCSETDRLYIFFGTSIFELRMYIGKGEFSRSIQTLAEVEERLNIFKESILNSDKLYFFYLLGYGNFGAGRINEALKWINKVINDKEVYQDKKLCVKSKILNLILHYELGNFELLDYLVISMYKYLMKNKFESYDEKIMIKFLKQLPAVSTKTQLLKLFSESLDKLKSNQQNYPGDVSGNGLTSFEIQNNFTNIAEFDLMSWLESKISGKRFDEVVRTKFVSPP